MDNGQNVAGVVVLLLCLAFSVSVAKVVTIDAAVGITGNLFILYADGEVMTVENNVTKELAKQTKLFLPESMKVSAAANAFEGQRILTYGDKYGFYVDFLNLTLSRKFKYGPKRRFVRDGKVDAAAWKGDQMYFFKGCKMAIRHEWNKWSKPTDMRSVGLPCNLDAAWRQAENQMTLLRGNQIWRWNADDSVDGPELFHDIYTLDGWELAPYEGGED